MPSLPLIQIFHSLGCNILFIVKVTREDGMQLMEIKFAEEELSVSFDQWSIAIT